MKDWDNKRAVLLTRVSTTDQKDNGYSLPQQKDLLYEFCYNYNIKIIDCLEEDFSGTTMDRPQIKELRKLINSKKVDLVLFHKWDRLGRKTVQAMVEIEAIRAKGVEINAIAEHIDFAVPQNKLLLYIYLGLAEVENDVRSQRTKNGIIGALKEGRHVNKAPIGYLNGKDPNNTQKPLIQLDPIKAPLIKMIFEEYATGQYSQESLRKKYYHKGIKRSKSQFSNMLSNIKYTGKILVPAQNGSPAQIVNGLHEAIVGEVTFYKVQQVKFGKANCRLSVKKSTKHEEFLPLRGGFLKCAKCGSNLTGSPSKSRNGKYHYYYHCNRRKGCKESFSATVVHDKLNKLIKSLQPYEEVILLFKEILVDIFKDSNKNREQEIRKLKRKKTEKETNMDNLTEKYISDSIDQSSYERLKMKYNKELQELSIQIGDLSNHHKGLDEFIDFGVKLLVNLNIFYKNSSTEIKRKIIGSIFSEKLVFDKNEYRTAKLNEGVALIFNYNKALDGSVNKKRPTISSGSYSVAGTGLEPVTFGL